MSATIADVIIRYASIAAIVALAILGIYLYRQHEHAVRQEQLAQAFKIQNAQVGPPGNEYMTSFPTAAERDKAGTKAFTDLAAKYPGTQEGSVAEYFLATAAADRGNIQEAEKRFKRL